MADASSSEDVGPRLTEDDKLVSLERLIPRNSSYKSPLPGTGLQGYKQIHIFHNDNSTVMPVYSSYVTPADRQSIDHVNSKVPTQFPGGVMPVGSINLTEAGAYSDDGGSFFGVSPCYMRGGCRFQQALSAGHVQEPAVHKVDPAYASWDVTAGKTARRRSFTILLHGVSDQTRYKTINPAIHSPPVSPEKGTGSLCHDSKAGAEVDGHTDVMIIEVEIRDEDVDASGQRPFLVASDADHALLRKGNAARVAVCGYPGPVSASAVPLILGQEVAPQDLLMYQSRINERLLNPDRKSISFGEIVSTNKELVKHTASTVHGMSGGPGLDVENLNLFHFVHIAGKLDSKERLYNRGISKDGPFLVCAMVDTVIPTFKAHSFRDPLQKKALRGWLAQHRAMLEGEGLWGKVVDAGLA